MAKIPIIIFCFFSLFPYKFVLGQTSGYRIDVDKLSVDARDPLYQSVNPGDTLSLVAGYRDYLLIKNFRGTAEKPIVIINAEGVVSIETDNYYGISIQNCRYIKLTGTGDQNQTYGFQIKRVSKGAGVEIGALSSDFEIDHIFVENTLTGDLYAKTDTDSILTTPVKSTFTQYKANIHDNYFTSEAPLEPKIQYNQFKLLKNPVTEFLIISIPRPTNSLVFLSIYNLRGEMILQSKQQQSPSANSTVQVNLSSIPSGTYIYTIRSGEDAGSGKFMKR
jgi:hypothetical protein